MDDYEFYISSWKAPKRREPEWKDTRNKAVAMDALLGALTSPSFR